jgi:peptide deformylase
LAVRRIVTVGGPNESVLHKPAKKVHRVDDYTRQLIQDLIDTVNAAHGAGLAAPQINVPLRAIVTNVEDNLQVVLNPEIVDQSEEEIEQDEGCLSIPGWWGPVRRKARVTVRGLSRTGKPIKFKAEGMEARCFQHEVDHLDGTLFIERMDDRSKLFQVTNEEEEEVMEEEHVLT